MADFIANKARWEELITRMGANFVALNEKMEQTDDLALLREMLCLIYHHGSVETNLRYLEPSPHSDQHQETLRLDSIAEDVEQHLNEVRALL